MKPTNDERREVARRLRYVAEHGAPEWATTACCIAECIGEDDYPLWNGSGLLFSKLADLIEPEERTCHIEYVKSGPFYDVFRFDCCGMEYSESRTDDGATELPLAVCPFCGAKVVDDHA